MPIYDNHPAGSAWHQGESVGFPDYVDAPHEPHCPFGHGLTYTTFEYSQLDLSSGTLSPTDGVDISFTVTNRGEWTATEVVQLYVVDRFASTSRPVSELAGFRRVELAPGEEARVTFRFEASQVALLDAGMRWKVEAGDVDVLVGASSSDLRLRGVLTITDEAFVDGAQRRSYSL